MPPSDSRPGRATVMSSRHPLPRRHALTRVHPVGSLRFLDRSFNARRPLSPRGVRPLRMLVAWRSMSGFTQSGRMATPTCVTRPNRVHAFALRLTPSPSQASTSRLPGTPLSRLHGERAIPMVSTFQLTRSTRLPDAPDERRWRSRNQESRRNTTSFLGSCFFGLIRLLICIHLRTSCLFIDGTLF